MRGLAIFFLVLISVILAYSEDDLPYLHPTVTIAFLARNAASNLPWFLGAIENLNYPKDRIAIWVVTDHNQDNTVEMLESWSAAVKSLYHRVNLTIGPEGRYGDEAGEDLGFWSETRYDNMIALRQEALDVARKSWSDYILMIDADQFIYDRDLLHNLIALNRPVVAPMMNSTSLYSNFWGEVSEEGFYVRSEDYLDILERRKVGVFEVPMVHSILLIDLNDAGSRYLKYYPPHPHFKSEPDDIIQFAFNARHQGVPMFVTNERYYGFLIPPVEKGPQFLTAVANLGLYIRLHHIHEGLHFKPSPHIALPHRKFEGNEKMGFDEVYMINLERRPDRRVMMEAACAELGIKYKYYPAVDGKQLNDTYLTKIGAKQLDGYLDPYHKRPMKMGEIGCFLSHYFIWKEMEEKGYKRILILEDDVRFRLNFVANFESMMHEADRHYGGWDLLYIGRKIMQTDEELVPNSRHLVYPGYTYWTLSYALTREGMTKLLSQDPLSHMLPVDEYLPIMFDSHDNSKWKMKFTPRNVIALSANPLMVEPLKYIGEVGYVSDTEDSTTITEVKQDPSTVETGDTKAQDSKFSTSDSETNKQPNVHPTHDPSDL